MTAAAVLGVQIPLAYRYGDFWLTATNEKSNHLFYSSNGPLFKAYRSSPYVEYDGYAYCDLVSQ